MATLNLQVAASADDAWRRLSAGGSWDTAFGHCMAGHYDSTYYQYGSGMHFQNVTIPQGAVINSAYLILTCSNAQSGTVCNTEISAEDTDNATAFSTASDFDTRYASRTTAQVNWDGLGAWTANTEYTSPDIKSVIQEIVDRPGWASGNAIAIFWEDFDNESSGAGRRDAYSYDGSTSKAPKLQINYTDITNKTSSDSGSGTESTSSRGMGVMEAGSGLEASLATAALLAGDTGSGLEAGGLLQDVFAQDEGGGVDSVRILTGKAGHDLRLNTHRGRVGITHKEVNL
jgi:hypothetical protein